MVSERKNFVRLAICFAILLPLLFLVYMTLGDSLRSTVTPAPRRR